MKDENGAEITISQTPAPQNKLTEEWNAATTTDERLAVIAKALGIL